VPLSSAISAELEPLFAGAELVELNSSPWPARLLEGESADATELPSPLAAFTTGAPSPAPPPTGPEETPIASIAHAIISEGGSAAESRAGDRGAGSNDDAPASRPGGPARRPTLDPPAPVIMPTTIETTRAATAAPPKPASRPAAGPAPSAGAPAPATATTTPPPASSWLNHVREEVEAATPGPAKNFRMPTAPAETGAPARGGASPAAPQLPRRRFPAVLAVALVALAVAAVAWFMWPDDGAPGARTSSSGSVPAVHVMSPQPTVFHRWFSTPGTVVVGRDQTLGFPSAGRIQDVLPPGTTFSAGETIAHLKGTAERELAVNRLRSRIAFLEQLHGSSTEAGNKAAARDAEAKLTLRKRELAMALAELAKLEIRPTLAGAVAEVLVPVGSVVGAHAPVLRLRAAGPRAVFAFSEAHLAAARELTFCRLETIPPEAASGNAGGSAGGARPVDCTLPVAPFPPAPGGAQSARSPAGVQPPAGARTPAGANDGGPRDGDGLEGKLAVDLVAGAALAPGTPVRLASARYENVFPVPREAVLHQDGADRVWVISGAGRTAEMRAVEVASTEPGFALVSRGIRTGEAVIVDPPASLQNGGEVYVAQ
jgi:multidrug efflux pump subunit AcrA (membrane-fusion protein)